MSWRSVVISSRCKLDLSMNYMVVRGEETQRIFLDEIAILIIENNAVSLTGCLLSELIERKVKIIFCDGTRTPQSELVPYYGCHNDSLKIKYQLAWDENTKKAVWTSIVRRKIENQAYILDKYGKEKESALLYSYIQEILLGDSTNREGHAAKVYFNALFGMDFSRNDEENIVNAALNYGYSLILSAVNREVSANGYLTQLGLFHDNQFNHFNLSCDIMEPFRTIVDNEVKIRNFAKFEQDEKHILVQLLNKIVTIGGTEQTILNAIKIYTKSVFDALNENNIYLIKFVENEL